MSQDKQPIVLIVTGAEQPTSVWCDRAQTLCWEQPLGRPEGSLIEPCRWCKRDAA